MVRRHVLWLWGTIVSLGPESQINFIWIPTRFIYYNPEVAPSSKRHALNPVLVSNPASYVVSNLRANFDVNDNKKFDLTTTPGPSESFRIVIVCSFWAKDWVCFGRKAGSEAETARSAQPWAAMRILRMDQPWYQQTDRWCAIWRYLQRLRRTWKCVSQLKTLIWIEIMVNSFSSPKSIVHLRLMARACILALIATVRGCF